MNGTTYASGETPTVNDVVRFAGAWFWWWLSGSQKMQVLELGFFPSGKPFIVVGWICKDAEGLEIGISRILTQWNPENFVKTSA